MPSSNSCQNRVFQLCFLDPNLAFPQHEVLDYSLSVSLLARNDLVSYPVRGKSVSWIRSSGVSGKHQQTLPQHAGCKAQERPNDVQTLHKCSLLSCSLVPRPLMPTFHATRDFISFRESQNTWSWKGPTRIIESNWPCPRHPRNHTMHLRVVQTLHELCQPWPSQSPKHF